jgi:hypothetical protein
MHATGPGVDAVSESDFRWRVTGEVSAIKVPELPSKGRICDEWADSSG